MAEDLRVNIIADASQAERALRGVETAASKAMNAIKGLGNEMQASFGKQSSIALQGAIGDVRRLGDAADQARAKVAALNLAFANKLSNAARDARNPSPFGAATGGGFDSRPRFGDSVASGIGDFAGSLVGAGAISASIYGAVASVGSYNNSVQDYYSPQAVGLANQGPLMAAKTLGVDATKAYNDYAAALIKTADALTVAERKQAVYNAAVAKGGKGAQIVRESEQYRATAAGQYETATDRASRAFKAFGLTLLEYGNPRATAAGIGIIEGDDYSKFTPRPFSFDPSIKGDSFKRDGSAGAAFAKQLYYYQNNQRIDAFFAAAAEAQRQGDLGRQGVEDTNEATYGARRSQLRSGIAAGDSSLASGVGALTSLEARRAEFEQKRITGSYGIRTGVYGQPTDQTFGFGVQFGETAQDTYKRAFDNADKYAAEFRASGIPADEVEKIRAAYLVQATSGIRPEQLTDTQRSTVQAALDRSIADQLLEVAKQSLLQARMDANLQAIRNKFVGTAEYDPATDPKINIFLRNNSDANVDASISSIRFADSAPNTFTNTPDTFAQDNY